MHPHKYHRSKKAQDKRYNEYKKYYYQLELRPEGLNSRQMGRLKKHNYGDCGNANCMICHNDKNWKPKEQRLQTKKDTQKLIKEQLYD